MHRHVRMGHRTLKTSNWLAVAVGVVVFLALLPFFAPLIRLAAVAVFTSFISLVAVALLLFFFLFFFVFFCFCCHSCRESTNCNHPAAQPQPVLSLSLPSFPLSVPSWPCTLHVRCLHFLSPSLHLLSLIPFSFFLLCFLSSSLLQFHFWPSQKKETWTTSSKKSKDNSPPLLKLTSNCSETALLKATNRMLLLGLPRHHSRSNVLLPLPGAALISKVSPAATGCSTTDCHSLDCIIRSARHRKSSDRSTSSASAQGSKHHLLDSDVATLVTDASHLVSDLIKTPENASLFKNCEKRNCDWDSCHTISKERCALCSQ